MTVYSRHVTSNTYSMKIILQTWHTIPQLFGMSNIKVPLMGSVNNYRSSLEALGSSILGKEQKYPFVELSLLALASSITIQELSSNIFQMTSGNIYILDSLKTEINHTYIHYIYIILITLAS